MGDVVAAGDSRQDPALLLVQLGRDQREDRGTHHLGCGVPEDPLGRGVPRQYGAVQLLADDGFIGRLDDRGEPRRRQRNLVGGGRCGIGIRQAEASGAGWGSREV
jgi:hypothetical protein